MGGEDRSSSLESDAIRRILEDWAETTRTGQLEDILSNHATDAVIYDVLPPMRYEGTVAYRRSWGDWHPETPSDGRFELSDLVITAGSDVAFAYGLIACGGTMPDGQVFSDDVRATFCLRRSEGRWKIEHQHISKPLNLKSSQS